MAVEPTVSAPADGRSQEAETRGLGASGASLTHVRGPGFEHEQPASPELTFAVLLSGASRPWRDLGDGLRVPRGAEQFSHRGGGIVTPHGTAVSWRVEGAHECLVWSIPFSLVEEEIGSRLPGGGGVLYRLSDGVVHDPLFSSLSCQLWEQAGQSDQLASLYADHAVLLLLARLAHLASGPISQASESKAKEQLAPWRLARAKQFLEANLAYDPTLQDVAAAAGLSPHHFVRAFRAATGLTPFQWLQHRRVQAAEALLRDSKLSLADIALQVGFKNQSHFTVVYRRATGTTPGRLRRDVGHAV